MGGAVSSGESNDDLIDNLCESDYIKTPLLERVFRSVDRALYYTEAHKSNAYKDIAWKDGNLHLSAPCIYSEVLENLELGPGMSFLNMGSGTGYFSTMCGLIIGKGGVNHGIELYQDVVDYSREKLDEFLMVSPAVDLFDFCIPEFVVGNCLDPISNHKRYDRIYCGAACPDQYIRNITDLLKIGGICVVPIGDSLVQITRLSESSDERKSLLPVSFASLISPRNGAVKKPIQLPEWKMPTLKELCRFEIRNTLRKLLVDADLSKSGEDRIKRRRRHRQERRRASRLLVVQRRRSGGEDGETGFVAVAYSMGNNSSDEDEDSHEERSTRGSDRDDEIVMESSDSEDDNNEMEMPGLVDIPDVSVRNGNNSGDGSDSGAFSQTTESVSSSSQPQAPASQSQNESTSSNSTSSSMLARSRDILSRARLTRARISTSTDGLLGRLRDIYRQREERDWIRQVRQSMDTTSRNLQRIEQDLTTINGQLDLSSTTSSSVRCSSENNFQSENRNAQEDTGSGSITTSLNTPNKSNKKRSAATASTSASCSKSRYNEDSCVWSTDTDSSIETSPETSTTASSAVSEDGPQLQIKNMTQNPNSANTESDAAVADLTETDGIINKDENNDSDKSDSGLTKDSISMQLKNKIHDLPLPLTVKLYLNYYRALE